MNTKKILLATTIQSILWATPVFAGDVEVSLPAATPTALLLSNPTKMLRNQQLIR